MRILFLENHDVFAATVVREFLGDHDVVVVPSVSLALAALHDAAFDCALVDFDLNDAKGDAFIRAARTAAPALRSVAVSSHDDGNAALVAAGADAVCRKSDFGRIASVLAKLTLRPRV